MGKQFHIKNHFRAEKDIFSIFSRYNCSNLEPKWPLFWFEFGPSFGGGCFAPKYQDSSRFQVARIQTRPDFSQEWWSQSHPKSRIVGLIPFLGQHQHQHH